MKKLIIIIAALSTLSFAPTLLAENCRYFYSGDGKLNIQGLGKTSFSGNYRKPDCSYDAKAVQKIRSAFGVRNFNEKPEFSLRLIEFLDYLQDNVAKGGKISVVSGYRSPSYNNNLRKNGRLAAKASMHQYGMASDVIFSGASSKEMWDYIRELGFGGAGYYHGKTIHVDVGPARFWDETTSGVDTDASDDNKLIAVITNFDLYRSNEPVFISFTRMTSFPIGVKNKLALLSSNSLKNAGSATVKNSSSDCIILNNIGEASQIEIVLPKKLSSGRYKLRPEFCGEMPESMLKEIESPEFEMSEK